MHCCPMLSAERKLMNHIQKKITVSKKAPPQHNIFHLQNTIPRAPHQISIVSKCLSPRLSGLELPTLRASTQSPSSPILIFPKISITSPSSSHLTLSPSNSNLHSPLLPQPWPESLPLLSSCPLTPALLPPAPAFLPPGALGTQAKHSSCQHFRSSAVWASPPSFSLCLPLLTAVLPSSPQSSCWKFPKPRHGLHLLQNLLRLCSKDRRGNHIRETQAADSSAPAGRQLCLVAIRTLVLIIEHSTEI